MLNNPRIQVTHALAALAAAIIMATQSACNDNLSRKRVELRSENQSEFFAMLADLHRTRVARLRQAGPVIEKDVRQREQHFPARMATYDRWAADERERFRARLPGYADTIERLWRGHPAKAGQTAIIMSH